MTEAPPAIRTSALSKAFMGVRALDALDLSVGRNVVVGMLGPAGAGKSTALKLLLGLTLPTGGGATVLGMDIATDGPSIRRRVGYLGQEACGYAHMTVRETLRCAARFFYRGPRSAIEGRVDEALELVRLQALADRSTKSLAIGARKRLGIAQAQIHHPDLLILDEPAAALDPRGRHDVLTVMARLRRRTTVLYATRSLEDVKRVSDSVAVLHEGTLVAHAPIEELLAGRGGGTFTLRAKGCIDRARDELLAMTWVSGLTTRTEHAVTILELSASDAEAAESQVLRLVQRHPGVTVLAFQRTDPELEHVFTDLERGGDRAG